MGKSTANVVDLESFRQRKQGVKGEMQMSMPMQMPMTASPMFVPVPVWMWWMPVWAPVIP